MNERTLNEIVRVTKARLRQQMHDANEKSRNAEKKDKKIKEYEKQIAALQKQIDKIDDTRSKYSKKTYKHHEYFDDNNEHFQKIESVVLDLRLAILSRDEPTIAHLLKKLNSIKV